MALPLGGEYHAYRHVIPLPEAAYSMNVCLTADIMGLRQHDEQGGLACDIPHVVLAPACWRLLPNNLNKRRIRASCARQMRLRCSFIWVGA